LKVNVIIIGQSSWTQNEVSFSSSDTDVGRLVYVLLSLSVMKWSARPRMGAIMAMYRDFSLLMQNGRTEGDSCLKLLVNTTPVMH